MINHMAEATTTTIRTLSLTSRGRMGITLRIDPQLHDGGVPVGAAAGFGRGGDTNRRMRTGVSCGLFFLCAASGPSGPSAAGGVEA